MNKLRNLPNFEYAFNRNSSILDVVLHGSNGGIENDFIQKIFNNSKLTKHSVIAFNFPYLDRKDEHSSGSELTEEKETLTELLNYINSNRFTRINLIGKSLGAIIASYFLRDLTTNEQDKFTITVLGYVLKEIDLKNFQGKITIIQGALDKYGDINVVKDDMKDAISNDITYISIPNADHSYKEPKSKLPTYQDVAISKIFHTS